MLKIGPSGNSDSFYDEGHKRTSEAAKWLSEKGLTAFEYSFGRGARMSADAAAEIKVQFNKYNIEVSAHAPYFTNFANTSDEMIDKSIMYIAETVKKVKEMGGRRVVFHPSSRGKMTRREAVEATSRNISKMMTKLCGDFVLCPETMGKINQIGTVEETIEFCKLDERLYPCFDFGHINSYTQGGIKSQDDYRRIIDYCFNQLGEKKTRNMHIHFSKIMYGAMGELKHLTFADTVYGPEYEPLAKVIDDYRLEPYIICESRGTMAEDAVYMMRCHKI